jgi:hypothetical protein
MHYRAYRGATGRRCTRPCLPSARPWPLHRREATDDATGRQPVTEVASDLQWCGTQWLAAAAQATAPSRAGPGWPRMAAFPRRASQAVCHPPSLRPDVRALAGPHAAGRDIGGPPKTRTRNAGPRPICPSIAGTGGITAVQSSDHGLAAAGPGHITGTESGASPGEGVLGPARRQSGGLPVLAPTSHGRAEGQNPALPRQGLARPSSRVCISLPKRDWQRPGHEPDAHLPGWARVPSA